MHTAISNKRAIVAASRPAMSVAFIVNGDQESPMGYRAREFGARLPYDIRIGYRSQRKFISILRFLVFLARVRPSLTYVFDISYSGVVSAALHKLIFRNFLIIETGDAITELVRATGRRGKVGLWLTRLLEKSALRIADRIVVRGSLHQRWLSQQGVAADVIQDGVDTRSVKPEDAGKLRRELGLDDVLTVGLVGSSVWSEKQQMCYGWDLVETLTLLKDKPVKGIMIGDGSGIAHLKARCREHGIEDNILFIGRVPFARLNQYLSVIDICLSTQTNDLVGQVRTTGKLPLYLAAGRFVLASNVGEAAMVLEKEMLVDYEGVKDEQYPRKLKTRILEILQRPELLRRGASNVSLAREHFDYGVLAQRMTKVIDATQSE